MKQRCHYWLISLIYEIYIYTIPNPNNKTIKDCIEMTGYLPDARVLAAAVECEADLFVTFDTEHFLQNPLIGPPNTKLRVVDAYKALDWISGFIAEQITEMIEEDNS